MDILTFIIHNSIIFATPLIFAALGGLFSERSGVVNIGLEGLMVIGAFSSAVFTLFFYEMGLGASSAWLAMLMAMIIGAIFSLPHALASITFKANQVVSGVALNFLAAGLSIFLIKFIFEGAGQTPTLPNIFKKISIPVLSDIPYLGPMLFVAYPTSYVAFVMVILVYIVIFKTPFGLRIRAVGEHPRAADTMGIHVTKLRYISVMISGALAALGGAIFPLAITNNFAHNTISGQGFMALAALIFGKWHPTGAMGAALFFGIANALAAVGQTIGLTSYIPREFLIMFPYFITIIALASFVGRADAPAALGKSYDQGGR